MLKVHKYQNFTMIEYSMLNVIFVTHELHLHYTVTTSTPETQFRAKSFVSQYRK